MKNAVILSRRRLLQGISCSFTYSFAAMGSLQANAQSNMPADSHNSLSSENRVVIYQDKAHFDSRTTLAKYRLPDQTGQSNTLYAQSINEREFLSRHWFA